jgi:hypothetical protein
MENLDDWLVGLPIETIENDISLIRDMELDNEKRTVEVIKKWKLDIDLKLYIQKANAYIYFYNWVKYSKRWSKAGNSPYNNDRILAAMPNNFENDYSNIPYEIKAIFEEENI